MIIALHVGMRGDAGDAVRSLLSQQNEHLTRAGWALPSALPPGDPEHEIDQIFAAWRGWVDAVRAEGADRVVLSDPRFTEGHFIQGEVARFVDELSQRGEVRAAALTRRIDDHVAADYLRKLREGRTRPMGTRELTASGRVYSYFPRLEKWISALGDDFSLFYCPPSGDPDRVLPAVALWLGLPEPPPIPATPLLPAGHADAMRQVNVRLKQGGPWPSPLSELRETAFQRLVSLSEGQEPLRMAPEVAAEILDRCRDAARSLTRAMPPDDAECFMSDELPPAVPIDEDASAALAAQVMSGLGVQAGAPRSEDQRPRNGEPRVGRQRARLDRAGEQARRALAADDDDAYRSALARIQLLTREVRRYREQIPAPEGTSRIPNRLVQYWEPWPPPSEMLPWLQSWTDIGMRHGVHRVVSFGEGMEAVVAAAGERGADAFRQAPHPAARADLYRYAELFLHGGWYVDAEHEALLPIADVHPWPVDHVFVVRSRADRMPNGFIGSVPNSRLMKDVLDEACTNVLERRLSRVIEMTGPEMFAPHVVKYLDQADASYVLLPSMVAFHVTQIVHNEAAYKAVGHWRDHDLTDDEDR